MGISVCNTHDLMQVFCVLNRVVWKGCLETLTCIRCEVVVEMWCYDFDGLMRCWISFCVAVFVRRRWFWELLAMVIAVWHFFPLGGGGVYIPGLVELILPDIQPQTYVIDLLSALSTIRKCWKWGPSLSTIMTDFTLHCRQWRKKKGKQKNNNVGNEKFTVCTTLSLS